ncbi:MAG: GC-type dockerin domain-anchored protein [Planctomycetota bacterium]
MKHAPLVVGTCLIGLAPIASAQLNPVRSSVEASSQIGLSVVDLTDDATGFDDQGAAVNELGPLAAPVSISSVDGQFTADTTASALFSNEASGVFAATQSYDGDQFSDEPTAQSFTHTLSGTFEYDFTLPDEGSARFEGTLINSGPSFIEFTVRVSVFSEFMPGSGFTGPFFEQLFTDQIMPGPTAFDVTVPLTADSGSYRIELRLSHSGISVLQTDPETGSATINWAIDAPTICPADVNGNGSVDGSDFFAWVTAFSANPRTPEQESACDVNTDGSCTESDFFAWVAAFGGTGCG